MSVTGWSLTTIGGSQRMTRTYPAKGTPTGTITLVHNSFQTCPAAGTTCSVTLSGSISAGNYLIIQAVTLNQVIISSINVGGTFVDGFVRQASFQTAGYVLNTTATAGPVVVTFSGAAGDTAVDIREYSISSGTLGFDAVSDFSNSAASTNPYVASTPTLSGLTSVLDSLAFPFTDNFTTAPSAPWGDFHHANVAGANFGIADHVNTTSNAGMSITSTSHGLGCLDTTLVLSQSPTACNATALMDSSGGSNGAAPTAATLATSTHGATVSGTVGEAWQWSLTDSTAAITYAAAAKNNLLTLPRFCSSGVTYANTGTLGLQWTTVNSSGTHYVQLGFPSFGSGGAGVDGWGINTNKKASAGMWLKTSLAQNSTVNMDVFTIRGAGDFINLIVFGTGSALQFKCEAAVGSCTGSPVAMSSNTLYFVGLTYVGNVGHSITIYDSSGNIVGSFTALNNGNVFPHLVIFGDSSGGTITAGGVMQIDKLQACYLGDCSVTPKP